MKTICLLLGCFWLISLSVQAQYVKRFKNQKSVYAEALGPGGLYSLNYERLFAETRTLFFGYRVGGSLYGERLSTKTLIGEVFTMTGWGDHHADIGLGLAGINGPEAVSAAETENRTALYAVPRVSYRYQRPTGRIWLRAGFTPFLKLSGGSCTCFFSPSAGAAVGYSF